MEGTSGAAERVLLRGRMREAALSSSGRSPAGRARDGRRESDDRHGEARRMTTKISDDGAHTPEERGLGAGPSRPAPRRASDRRCPGRAGRGKASPRAIAERRRWTASRPRQPLAGSPSAGRPPETAGDQPVTTAGSLLLVRSKRCSHDPRWVLADCLFAEVDGRRSVARTRCESTWSGQPSLSPRGRGQEGAGSRLEAAKAASTVAGVHAAAKAMQGRTHRWKALWTGEAAVVDATVGETALARERALPDGSVPVSRDRERQKPSHPARARSTTPRRAGSSQEGPGSLPPSRGRGRR